VGGLSGYLTDYALLALLAVVGLVFVTTAFVANRLLRPDVPTAAKQTTYESGMDPIGSGWGNTHVRYYVFAYLYVVFAVDAAYLFPWATVFASVGFGAVTLGEMGVFIGFLAVGLVYAWRRGVLRWV
jgi:NADH-quinone oxidoreductase subunit A